jgi:hypothetical protein
MYNKKNSHILVFCLIFFNLKTEDHLNFFYKYINSKDYVINNNSKNKINGQLKIINLIKF